MTLKVFLPPEYESETLPGYGEGTHTSGRDKEIGVGWMRAGERRMLKWSGIVQRGHLCQSLVYPLRPSGIKEKNKF